MRHRSSAFSLIELLVVIAIIALLVSILLPALREARRAGRQTVCIANMQQLGRAHHTYAADFKDYIAAYNGRHQDREVAVGVHRASWPTLHAVGFQAQDILTKYVPDYPHPEFMPTSEFMAIPVLPEQHSHLVLAEYLGERLPIPGTACPEDRARLEWQKDPRKLIDAKGIGFADYNAKNIAWFPYGSSYQLMPAAWLRDPPRPSFNMGSVQQAFTHGNFHDRYFYVNKPEPIGGNKLGDVFSPSQKVAVADSQQRHVAKDIYAGYEPARQPLLFWDSSVSVRVTRDANPGWERRHSKDQVFVSSYEYKPDLMFESPALIRGGAISAVSKITGRYKWTRGGLRGIDFGGQEIDTSGW